MFKRRLIGLVASTAVVLAACSGGGTPAPSGGAAGCTVGVSWNNYQEERWAKWDEPAIKAAIEAGGGKYISNDAKSSSETQATNVENLISQGAKVIIILAQDRDAAKAPVEGALSQGIPVVAYDRLIEAKGALYITFDNELVGQLEAQGIFDLVPKGNWVIIKGNKADANADFLRAGGEKVIGDAVKSGDIKIVGETYTDNWDPKNAQTEMEQFLTANNNDVDAVWSENDGMATGVIAALKAQGLNGKVPVSGQDGDKANLNHVALGNQAVDVWKDARLLGKTAGEAAMALCADKDVTKIANSKQFTTPYAKVDLTSVFLQPQPIKKDNLNVVIDAGWISKADACAGVTDTTSVPACK